jgi:copper transport protein
MPRFIAKLFFLLILSGLWLTSPSQAKAHADLAWSNPSDGEVYTPGALSHLLLQFDESIEVGFSSVQVYDSQLVAFKIGELASDPDNPNLLRAEFPHLPENTYTVMWVVVSQVDNHISRGMFHFSVGESKGENSFGVINTPEGEREGLQLISEAVIRFLMFTSSFLAVGTVFFQFQLRKLASQHPCGMRNLIHHQISSWGKIAALLWLLASFLILAAQLISYYRIVPLDTTLIDFFGQSLSSRLGSIWILRLFVGLSLLYYWIRFPSSKIIQKIIPAPLMTASISLTSHAAAGELWPAVATLMDWVHLTANGIWLGGLAVLVFVVFPINKTHKGKDNTSYKKILQRFSKIALICVLLSVTTGLFATTLHVLEPKNIINALYGNIIFVKIFLGAIVIGVGGIVRFRLKKGDAKLVGKIRLELFFACGVVFVSALLTSTPPPAPEPIHPDDIPFRSDLRRVEIPDSNLQAYISLAPNYIGWNRYLVVLHTDEGVPVLETERVRLRFLLPEVEAKTSWRELTLIEDGLYVADGQELVLVGEWQIELDIRQYGKQDARTSIDWPLTAPPAYIVPPGIPRLANWLTLLLFFLSVGWIVVQTFPYPQIAKWLNPSRSSAI